MAHVNWKLLAGGAIASVVIVLLVQRLTRAVDPFRPPPDRQTGAWGTLDSETARRLQALLDQEVNRLKVPGLQAFVSTSAGRTWSGTGGTVDLAREEPFGREHLVRVGSVTKSFTAVLVLKLVEEGRLSLDDALAKWFPGFPRAEAITVRQLLSHTSGIPEFLDAPQVLIKSIIPWTKWQPQEMLDIAAGREPHFAPGSGWHYSNTNYVLLGLIAERVTGQTAAELLRDRIIAPLGLANTRFVPYEPAPPTPVRGFDRDLSHFPGMLEIGPGDAGWATAAFTSGALASTADDLGVFYGRLFAGALLPPSLMKEMLTFVPASNPGFAVQDGYGLGLMRLQVDGQELVGHVGQFMGSTSIAMYSPGGGYLIVVNTNLSYPDLVGVVAGLQKIIRSAPS